MEKYIEWLLTEVYHNLIKANIYMTIVLEYLTNKREHKVNNSYYSYGFLIVSRISKTVHLKIISPCENIGWWTSN